ELGVGLVFLGAELAKLVPEGVGVYRNGCRPEYDPKVGHVARQETKMVYHLLRTAARRRDGIFGRCHLGCGRASGLITNILVLCRHWLVCGRPAYRVRD